MGFIIFSYVIIALFFFVVAWGAVMALRKINGQTQNKAANGIWAIACVFVLVAIIIIVLITIGVGALANIG